MTIPRIKASAVVHLGRVYTGRRHSDAIGTAFNETFTMPVLGCQGFILDDENETFVDRWQGMLYAKKSGQVPADKKSEILFSEDLW